MSCREPLVAIGGLAFESLQCSVEGKMLLGSIFDPQCPYIRSQPIVFIKRDGAQVSGGGRGWALCCSFIWEWAFYLT